MRHVLTLADALAYYDEAKACPARQARFKERERLALEAVRRADELEDLRTRGGRPKGRKKIEVVVGQAVHG